MAATSVEATTDPAMEVVEDANASGKSKLVEGNNNIVLPKMAAKPTAGDTEVEASVAAAEDTQPPAAEGTHNATDEPVSTAAASSKSSKSSGAAESPASSPQSENKSQTGENKIGENKTGDNPEVKEERQYRARKVCISFGYDGTAYRGLQMSYAANSPETIEKEMIEALREVRVNNYVKWKEVE
jgi:hypothetical protein